MNCCVPVEEGTASTCSCTLPGDSGADKLAMVGEVLAEATAVAVAGDERFISVCARVF